MRKQNVIHHNDDEFNFVPLYGGKGPFSSMTIGSLLILNQNCLKIYNNWIYIISYMFYHKQEKETFSRENLIRSLLIFPTSSLLQKIIKKVRLWKEKKEARPKNKDPFFIELLLYIILSTFEFFLSHKSNSFFSNNHSSTHYLQHTTRFYTYYYHHFLHIFYITQISQIFTQYIIIKFYYFLHIHTTNQRHTHTPTNPTHIHYLSLSDFITYNTCTHILCTYIFLNFFQFHIII